MIIIGITPLITTMPTMNVTCTKANVCGLSETLGNSKVRPGIVLKWEDDFGNLNQFTNIMSLTGKLPCSFIQDAVGPAKVVVC